MPAKDKFHDAVVNALIKDGWIITADPLFVKYGDDEFFIDIGAERVIAAEKGNEKIAVEIKSFVGRSENADIYDALGQFLSYRSVLRRKEPDRRLYLAVSEIVFVEVLESDFGRLIREDYNLHILTFDAKTEEIVRWIS